MPKIEFYDVKTGEKVALELSYVRKVKVRTITGVRYGLRGKTPDGRMLTKYINQDEWEAIPA